MAVPHRPSVLLESGKQSSGQARYSIVAANPYLIFSGDPATIPWKPHTVRRGIEGSAARIIQLLGPCLVPRSDSLPPFIGGAVGYLSYDAVRHYECSRRWPPGPPPAHDLEFLFFDLVVVIDHQTRTPADDVYPGSRPATVRIS